MFLYETHLHTYPVSLCAHVSVSDTMKFYKSAGYAGIFITNHFVDANINIDHRLPYEERINFFFSDYEEASDLGAEIGLDVFCGVEMSYNGSDFLVYGLDKKWYLDHPELEGMKKSDELRLLADNGALIIHAHPFREAGYIDHIRLYPRHVHGVEIYNANRTDFENEMAEKYAEHYRLLPFAGTDNHIGGSQKVFGGMQSETRITSEKDFIERFKRGELKIFRK
ncbi:MAG: histidinol phosphatase [Oscillospiraceae bacterium]|nr:histidinol phosphatase [Oscillospiraceae bacterium]